MSEQIKRTSESFPKKSYKSTNGNNSVLNKLILHSFLLFLNKELEFLNFLTVPVLVFYKPVTYCKKRVNFVYEIAIL